MNKTSYLYFLSLLIALIAIVVSIYVLYDHSEEDTFNIEESIKGVVEIECIIEERVVAYGSGFIVNYEGMKVVTNAHVVIRTDNGIAKVHDQIRAKFFDSDLKHNLHLISLDSNKDIAVLGFHDESLNCTALDLNTKQQKYGTKIYAIGNARGYGLSVSDGVVSVPEIIIVRNGVERSCMGISTLINEGDSGGPVLNASGEVIGMISFRLRDNENNVVYGVGYAVMSKDIDAALSKIGLGIDNK